MQRLRETFGSRWVSKGKGRGFLKVLRLAVSEPPTYTRGPRKEQPGGATQRRWLTIG